MGEGTGFSCVRAVALEERPAYCDLGWVMFVSAGKATIARTSGIKSRARLVDVFFPALGTL